MKEKVYILPNYFFGQNFSDVNVFFYQSDKSSLKNKVKFNQNLICFLQEGNKEIYNNSYYEKFDESSIILLPAGNVLMTDRPSKNGKYKTILLFFSDGYLTGFIKRNKIIFKKTEENKQTVKIKKDDYSLNFEHSLELLHD